MKKLNSPRVISWYEIDKIDERKVYIIERSEQILYDALVFSHDATYKTPWLNSKELNPSAKLAEERESLKSKHVYMMADPYDPQFAIELAFCISALKSASGDDKKVRIQIKEQLLKDIYTA